MGWLTYETFLRFSSYVRRDTVLTVTAHKSFETRCDQAVAQDTATQAYVRQLEQDYDTTGDEAPRPPRDEDFNPEQLMHELEDFLRQERDRGTE